MYRGMSLRVGVMIVALLLGSGAAFANPLSQGHPPADSPSPLSQAWHWMVSLFDAVLATIEGDPTAATGGGEALQGATSDGSMGMDPNGGW